MSSQPAAHARRARAPGAVWLAARIVGHLKELDLEPGAHITEQGLADHFKVSRSPIRVALAGLLESGVVEREPNRGFFLSRSSAELAGTEAGAPEEDSLYYRIAEDRLNGKVPQKVNEAQLVRRYRVTRRRVSAALSRMAHEGWLERLPRQGWVFAPMLDSVKAYEDGYRMRAVLEPAALRTPGYHLPAEVIQRLRQVQRDVLANNGRYTDAETFEIGTSFHEALVAASGNAFMLDTLQRINSLRRLFEYRAKRDRAGVLGQYREHVALLDLLEAGKLEKAAILLEKHLGGAGKMKARLVSQPKPTKE